MTFDLAICVLGLCVLPISLYRTVQQYRFDLKFYRENGWDYTKDSGNRMYPGGIVRIHGMAPIPNRFRVELGYPLAIIVHVIMLIGLAVATVDKLWG